MKQEIKIEKVNKAHFKNIASLLHNNMSHFLPNLAQIDIIWEEYIAQSNVYAIVLIHESSIIGFGSVMIETKIRGGKMGHIEDIVIDEKYQLRGYGNLLINNLVETACSLGCYKVSLQCKHDKIEFYEKCDFACSGTAMQRFLT